MRAAICAALAGLTLAAAGCGGSEATATKAGEGGTIPAGASVAPESTALFLTLNTDVDSDQWRKADALLDRFPGREALLDAVRDELADENLDWNTDVKPALGDELDVVVLSVPGDEDAEAVALLQPDDEAKLDELLRKVDEPLAKREIEGWTAVAETDAVLDAFESARAAGSLAGSRTFERALKSVPGDALARAFANGKEATDAFGKALGGVRALPSAGQLRSAALALVAEDDGVRVTGSGETDGEVAANYESQLIEDVPGDALLYLSARGDESALEGTLRDLQLSEALGFRAEELAALFGGEAALYVRPAPLVPEVTLLLAGDGERFSTVRSVLEQLGERSGVEPRSQTFDGVEGYSLPLGLISIHYASFDGKIAVTTTPRGIRDLRDGGGKLPDDADFRAAKEEAGMGAESAGFVYADLEQTLPLLDLLGSLQGGRSPQVSENLRPLRRLFAYASAEGEKVEFAGFVRID